MEKSYLSPPNPEVASWIASRLEDLEIHYDRDMISVVVAAYEDILRNNFEAKGHLASMLNFDWRRGESDKKYEVFDPQTGDHEVTKGNDITFMHATIHKSKFIPSNHIREIQIELEGCDGCGILSHCTKEIRNKISDRLEKICNHCLVYDDQLRGEGDLSLCSGCTKTMCEHHPTAKRRFA